MGKNKNKRFLFYTYIIYVYCNHFITENIKYLKKYAAFRKRFFFLNFKLNKFTFPHSKINEIYSPKA